MNNLKRRRSKFCITSTIYLQVKVVLVKTIPRLVLVQQMRRARSQCLPCNAGVHELKIMLSPHLFYYLF